MDAAGDTAANSSYVDATCPWALIRRRVRLPRSTIESRQAGRQQQATTVSVFLRSSSVKFDESGCPVTIVSATINTRQRAAWARNTVFALQTAAPYQPPIMSADGGSSTISASPDFPFDLTQGDFCGQYAPLTIVDGDGRSVRVGSGSDDQRRSQASSSSLGRQQKHQGGRSRNETGGSSGRGLSRPSSSGVRAWPRTE